MQQQDTQWRIVYNPKDLEIEFRFKKSKRSIHLEFKNIDFNNCKIYPIPSNNDDFVDYPEFIPYSLQNNMQLLDSVFTQLIRLDEVDPSAAQKTQTTINQYLVIQDPDSL